MCGPFVQGVLQGRQVDEASNRNSYSFGTMCVASSSDTVVLPLRKMATKRLVKMPSDLFGVRCAVLAFRDGDCDSPAPTCGLGICNRQHALQCSIDTSTS